MRLESLVLAGAIASASGAATQEKPVVAIERVAWLQGCWESASPQRTVEEQWMSPRGRSMIGVGRTVRGDRLVEYELVVLREQDGQLAYQAHPSGQPSAVFLSRSVGDAEVLFENPAHDFPQRVGYRRDGPDALLAWIEGTRNGQARRVEFPYRRVACPGK
jgi:hypothetical protein